MNLILLVFALLTVNAQASSFITCDLNVKILSFKDNIAHIKVLSIKQGNSGFGDCSFSIGKELEVKIENPKKIKKAKSALLRYSSYSGMGPKGPVAGITWTAK